MQIEHTAKNGEAYTVEAYKVAGRLIKVRLRRGPWSYEIALTWGPGNLYQALDHAIKLAEKHAAGERLP